MHMFDWIFFAIMIPIPGFLLWDMYINRRTRSSSLTKARMKD